MATNLWPLNSGVTEGFSIKSTEATELEFEQEKGALFVEIDVLGDESILVESDDEDNDDFEIALVEFDGNSPTTRIFKSFDDVNTYVSEPLSNDTTRILMIQQLYSGQAFKTSSEALRLLFTHLSIRNSFWQTLRNFVRKPGLDRESCGGFQSLSTSADGSMSMTYTTKYSALHEDQRQYSPWTLRQTAAHHQYSEKSTSHTFVLLSPSEEVTEYFTSISSVEDFDPSAIHPVILSSATERWDDYLSYQEHSFKKLATKTKLSTDSSNTTSRQIGFKVHQSDAQAIQGFQDTLLATIHMLEQNHSIFTNVIKMLPRFNSRKLFRLTNFSPEKIGKLALESLAAQTAARKARGESLLRRLDGVATLVRSILDAQSLFAIQASSTLTNELATLAREDAKKTTRDARRLNTITVLGLIYLPASFVATLLGTQYVKVGSSKNGNVTLIVESEMVIFVVLTMILLAITIGSWLMWENWTSLQERVRLIRTRTEKEKDISVV